MKHRGWKIRLSSLISVRLVRGLPRLVVHEKYERVVKWVLRILTLVGVLTSLATLPPVMSLAVAMVLLIVEQFFERAAFEYTTIYAVPPPDFPYRQESWIEILYMLPTNPVDLENPDLPSICGLVFDDGEQARGMARVLDAWATAPDGYGSDNIVLSFVMEDEAGYSAHVYPDVTRRGLGDFFEETRRLQLEEKLAKNQQGLVFFVRLGKYFKLSASSPFHAFVARQERFAFPYLLSCFVKEDGDYIEVDSEHRIRMTHLRVNRRCDLSKRDIEWEDARTTRWRLRGRRTG